VAVCVSGACRGSLVRNNERMKAKFPSADFYYATWSTQAKTFQSAFPFEQCEYFAEPTPHYHPYTGIAKEHHTCDYYQLTVDWAKQGGKSRLEWTSHHTKQILIHAWLTQGIRERYDVIVRTRFDAYISRRADFSSYLADTYENYRANCFGTTRPTRFDELFEVEIKPGSIHANWMLDHVIIHNADRIDAERVESLYRDKRLHAAEYGWHQVLGAHRNHSGWVNPEHSVLDRFQAA
jgi:hypothetical protein